MLLKSKMPHTMPTFPDSKSTSYSGSSTNSSHRNAPISMRSWLLIWAKGGFSKKSAGPIGKKTSFPTKSVYSNGTEET